MYETCCTLSAFEYRHFPNWVKGIIEKKKITVVWREYEPDVKEFFITADSDMEYIFKFEQKYNDCEFRVAIHNGHEVRSAKSITMQEFNKSLGIAEPRQMNIFDFFKGGVKKC